MIEKKLAEEVKSIEMPSEMRERILEHCDMKTEEMTMRKNNGKNLFRKPMVAAAVLAACLCVTGVSAMAATGKLSGFFQDVKGMFGAVTGTTYEQSTAAPLVDGTASVSVALPDVAAGTYKLVITELIGTAKADQSLKIHGEWECEFSK